MNFKAHVPVFAAALWWGSLTAVGFIVVPLLFHHLPSPAMAGRMAAKLFTGQAWTSIGCGMVVLYTAARPEPVEGPAGASTSSARTVRVEAWTLAGVLLALLVEFAVAPRIVARQDLALWHSVGSAMYAAQWLCAGVVLWRVGRLG